MKSEISKNGKIIDELVTFFLKKGHHDLKIAINYLETKTEITLCLKNLTSNERALLEECLSQGRDYALENYGWELMGESEESAELNLVGMCIDNYQIEEEENNETKLLLIRNH